MSNRSFLILRCEFLIQSRGQEYISNIQDAHFHLGETVVRALVPFCLLAIKSVRATFEKKEKKKKDNHALHANWFMTFPVNVTPASRVDPRRPRAATSDPDTVCGCFIASLLQVKHTYRNRKSYNLFTRKGGQRWSRVRHSVDCPQRQRLVD